MTAYFRPMVQHGAARPPGARSLVGGDLWFAQAECLRRDGAAHVVPASEIPQPILERLTHPRAAIAGLDMNVPQIMGILNVTPDSFSDGGDHLDPDVAGRTAGAMIEAGAGLIDIGGESTRPGAVLVPEQEEISRIRPVIAALRKDGGVVISVDTRKAAVAAEALAAGADLVNDVSGFTFDPGLATVCVNAGAPVCVMHAQGDPATMQQNPRYDNVLLDVYDFLEGQIDRLERAGIARDAIIVDPGIGFGKTLAHNLTLLRNLSVFHGLGCPVLLGASRKGMIGSIGQAPRAQDRAPGSIAVGLAALAQGVQILRVHDVAETAQAMRLWRAVQ